AVLALALVALVGVNALAGRADRTLDVTAGSRLTLSSETRRVLHQVTSTLTIQPFVQPDTPSGRDAAAVASRYHDANHHIGVDVIDPDAEPGKAREAGVTQFGTTVLRYAGRRADVPEATEVQLTSAIVRLLRGTTPVACFVTGHGEPSITDEGPQGLSSFAQ